MPSIGGVTFFLDADSVKLQRELLKAQRSTQTAAQRMQRSMSRAFRQIRRLAGGVGVALGGLFTVQTIRRQLQYAGNLQRVAETVAFTAEEVQELRFAAGQLNLEQRTLDMALQRFSRRMGEAAQNTGEALKTVQQYGIEVRNTDGSIRSNIDILKDWAQVISNVDDEQERLRIAFKLFDSEGAPLVRLLSQGVDGMELFAAEARELGIVLGEDLVNDAAEADRVFNQMKQTIDAKLAAQVAENADEMVRLAEAIGSIAAAAIAGIDHVRTFFGAIKTGMDGLNAFADRILGEEGGDRITEAADAYAALKKELDGLKGFAGGTRADIASSLEGEIADLEKRTQAALEHWNRLKQAAVDTHRATIEANVAAADAAKNAVEETVAAVAEADELLDELSIEGKLDRILRPEIKEDVEEFQRSTEGWFQSLMKVKDEAEEISDVGKEMGFVFQSAFEDAVIEGKKLGDVFKSLLKDIARMILRIGVTNPLGNFIGGLFGGGKAGGGRVSGGTTYLVGEQGPELFTPGGNGFITPNHAMQGGGASISYNIDARGVDEERIMQRMVPILEQTVETTRSLVKRDRLEGAL